MGGNAFPGSLPLSRERADRVLSEVRSVTGWEIEPVGSYGRKPLIPDLDVIVPEEQFNAGALAALGAVKQYGLGGAGLRYVSDGQAHQVDFFPVVSLDWGRWARAGAMDSSPLRAQLLKAAAATMEEPGVDFHVWRGAELVGRAGRTLDQRKGLRRIFQHRIRKNRRGLLKNALTVDQRTWERLFRARVPDVPTITDPAEVRRRILGVDVDGSASEIARHVRATFPPRRVAWMRAKLRERGFVWLP